VSDRWAIADLRATAIMDRTRTGAVAERNRRKLDEATQAREPASTPSCKHDGPQARGHESTPPDGWLPRLMACGSFAGRLEPEQELSAWVAAELRRLTRSGALRAVWSCHPAEVRMGGRIGQMLQSLLLFMGVVPGSSDFVFTWGAGSGWIELKIEERQPDLLKLRQDGRARAPRRTYLRDRQPDFREWCLMLGVKHACCRSVPEVLATLRAWGRLM
jgi:hypothetical protein